MALILSSAGGTISLAADHIVASAQFDACAFVVTADGDVFASEYLDRAYFVQGPWSYQGNAITAAGASSGDPLVGATFNNNSGPVYVVSRGGNLFRLGFCSGVSAVLESNIFLQAGRSQPNQEIVNIGWNAGAGGAHLYAAANDGDVFRKNTTGGLSGEWQFVGTIPVSPTASVESSWGSLKARYRQPGAAQPAPQDR